MVPMAAAAVKSNRMGIWPMLILFVLLLVSLSLMSDATNNSERFGQLYSWLLLINALGLVVLIGLIGSNLYWLVSQYRARAPGAQLTSRLVVTFVILAVLPISVVYYFSLQYLQHGIDSWFDVQIEQALDDALELGRGALDVRLNDLLRVTEGIADKVADMSPANVPIGLYDMRVVSSATELTLFGLDGRIIASSSAEGAGIVPDRPSEQVLMSLAQGRSYVGIDPVGDAGLYVRTGLGRQHRHHGRCGAADTAGPVSDTPAPQRTRRQCRKPDRALQEAGLPENPAEIQLYPDAVAGAGAQPALGGMGGVLFSPAHGGTDRNPGRRYARCFRRRLQSAPAGHQRR